MTLQTTTYAKLESLKVNLHASFLTVPDDHEEVKQVVGTTQEVTKVVLSRLEDATFASSLGSVLLQHVTQLVDLLQAGKLQHAWQCSTRAAHQLSVTTLRLHLD